MGKLPIEQAIIFLKTEIRGAYSNQNRDKKLRAISYIDIKLGG
ncbi:hypothetical protein SAMN06265219_10234 [Gracilimonas mengyeensis]|uniref:Uncharacterized protein n=1 Tax=Gracilimonas mengyeensis TaxID=1302730 RepID=A0A521B5L9_9BACT|nr:hypothetical protein SAMN06265219_10234 [Gracilimonas mengyeensis]